MSLIQPLKKGNLHIIGDVHGEIEALRSLLSVLGYDKDGNHPLDYKLVFVGDLCDRGPDSPSVIKLVKHLVEQGNAQAILGNHELNLLQLKAKDGAGWYFEERFELDKNYAPFNVINPEEKEELYQFLAHLPLALENDELRVVHATWDNEKIQYLKDVPLGNVAQVYNSLEDKINQEIQKTGLLARYHAEQNVWAKEQIDPDATLPFLSATSEYNLIHQMANPMRVLTSGVEQKAEHAFYASGKWRFVERYSWWDRYEEEKPVVVGHFWRKFIPEQNSSHELNVFENINPTSWHGKKNNVFCVDFSVGGRFMERNKMVEPGTNTKLAALSWPNKELILETGEVLETSNYNSYKKVVKRAAM